MPIYKCHINFIRLFINCHDIAEILLKVALNTITNHIRLFILRKLLKVEFISIKFYAFDMLPGYKCAVVGNESRNFKSGNQQALPT
jgi:hypothetical protein